MRKAKRQMRGVKLQYTDDDRVTFDDVAGIGESKVSWPLLPESRSAHRRSHSMQVRAPLLVAHRSACSMSATPQKQHAARLNAGAIGSA